jgi:hypothetical protein
MSTTASPENRLANASPLLMCVELGLATEPNPTAERAALTKDNHEPLSKKSANPPNPGQS